MNKPSRDDNLSCAESLDDWLEMQKDKKCSICGEFGGEFFVVKEEYNAEVHTATAKNFDDLKRAGLKPQWACKICAGMVRRLSHF